MYQLLWWLLLPIVHAALLWRYRKYTHYRSASAQRFGRISVKHMSIKHSQPLWIHAASVGEVILAEPLIKQLQSDFPDRALLVTTTTPTGAARLAGRLPEVEHRYLPYDIGCFHRGWQLAVKPALLIIIERELWPAMLNNTACPIVIYNARLSQRSYTQYAKRRSFAHVLMKPISQVLCQTSAEAERFRLLGAANVTVTGNAKYDVDIDPGQRAQACAIKQTIGDRPVWLAASTHAPEERIILQAHQQLLERYPNVLLILVPRHIERRPEVLVLLDEFIGGGRYHCASKTGTLSTHDAVYYVDTIGQLFTLYGVCDMAFVGGSLIPNGGQNMIEPASWSKPIMVGPYTENFLSVSAELEQQGGLVRVRDASSITEVVDKWLKNEASCSKAGRQAKVAVSAHKGAFLRQYNELVHWVK